MRRSSWVLIGVMMVGGMAYGDVVDDWAKAIDQNGSGMISWNEVSAWLEIVDRTFTYKVNSVVLDPAEFVYQGGGDCDDFAVFIAWCMNLSGIPAYVAGIYPRGGGEGHAVVIVRDDFGGLPAEWFRYKVREGLLRGGSYILVDYGNVGRFSRAEMANWTVAGVWEPWDMVGLSF